MLGHLPNARHLPAVVVVLMQPFTLSCLCTDRHGKKQDRVVMTMSTMCVKDEKMTRLDGCVQMYTSIFKFLLFFIFTALDYK